MALFNCPECGKEISDKAIACPNCGAPISQSKDFKFEDIESSRLSSSERPVSTPLFLGILVLPFIFGWFTLRNGYGKKVRLFTFCWLIFAVFYYMNAFTSESDDNQVVSQAKKQAGSVNSNINISRGIDNIKIEFDIKEDMRKTINKMAGITPGSNEFYFGDMTFPLQSFYLRNNNNYAVKNVAISCKSYPTVFDEPIERKSYTIYGAIGPESFVYQREFNFGFFDQQSKILKCEAFFFDR